MCSLIDHTIDDALTKLMNQINACRRYEQEGWQYLRSISREVSDKVARDHYYAMDTVWKNVKNVQKYIEGEFSQHFNELATDAKKREYPFHRVPEIGNQERIVIKFRVRQGMAFRSNKGYFVNVTHTLQRSS